MKDLLPKEFKPVHAFAFYVHNLIVDLIKSGEQDGLFNVSANFDAAQGTPAIPNLSGEALCDWLEASGYSRLVTEMTYRQLCVALMSDFCGFVYESLSCSQKAKTTIAYALLRKPFKEDLLFLEWLLVDREGFLRAFMQANPNELAVDAISSDQKKEIIEKAVAEVPSLLNARRLYDLRYRKPEDDGFERLWHKATHLITTFRDFQTECQNLNWIFGNHPDDRLSQWAHFYTFVPPVLYHAFGVMKALTSTLGKREDPDEGLKQLKMIAGLMLWIDNPYNMLTPDLTIKSLLGTQKIFVTYYPACSKPIKLGKRNAKSLYWTGDIKCFSCKTRVLVGTDLNLSSAGKSRQWSSEPIELGKAGD